VKANEVLVSHGNADLPHLQPGFAREKIKTPSEQCPCDYCLAELAIGDDAWVLPDGAIYCSRHCAKEAESEAKCLLFDAAPALLKACKALLRGDPAAEQLAREAVAETEP
jgi:hypothetical protein